MEDYVDFVEECIKSLENKPTDTVIEFICPFCGGTTILKRLKIKLII